MRESGYSTDTALLQDEQRYQEVYIPLEVTLQTAIAEITAEDPTVWLKTAWRSLHRMEHCIQSGNYPPEIQEFLQAHLDEVFNVLKEEQKVVEPTDSVEQLKFANERARSIIHEISELLLVETKEQTAVEVQKISLEDIFTHQFQHGFQVREQSHLEGSAITNLEIYSPTRDQWFTFPLPPTHQMVHKGGFPRVILKILCGAPPETIESELPPNDFDVIAWDKEAEAYAAAEAIGVDLSGVEILTEENPNFSQLLQTRDIDLNSCFIGKDGLVYSAEAALAAKSGHVQPIPSYRGLYGTNMLKYEGEALYSGRDMMRGIKFVAEGKALSFSFKELNKQIDMGIYALVLAEKFLRKPEWEQLLDKMWHIFQQTGQVQEEEKNIWQTLDRMHADFPFLEMENRDLPSDSEVSEWLLGKLGKQALHTFRSEHAVPSLLKVARVEHDTEEQHVSLENYRADERIGSLESVEQLSNFLKRCAERNLVSDAELQLEQKIESEVTPTTASPEQEIDTVRIYDLA